ncbi:heparinase II/III domain-containing protein [Salinicoccus bachuensis]|uniref:Heparinase II/III family protein n=1 Tax=Salinicoccus bachuensis TaxID=3136731 RepID=A0ABZ3CJX8_9STAP
MALRNKIKSLLNKDDDNIGVEAPISVDESGDIVPQDSGDELLSHVNRLSREQVVMFEKKSSQTEKIADNALQDVIIPFPNFEPVDFANGYNWDAKNKKYGKSYQLYLQSLRVINDLTIRYEETAEAKYLRKSQDIIESWMEYMFSEPENEMLWYDHPTANRAQLIMQFMYHAKDKVEYDVPKYMEVLDRHAKVLSNPDIYNFNNHGLMMDRTLLVLGTFLNRDDLFEKGFGRATETFWYNFSAQGVHLENSPDYHQMVVDMYKEIQEYLELSNRSFSDFIIRYIDKADEYFDILVKPDGHLPAIGDSSNTSYPLNNKKYINFNDFESGMNIIQRDGAAPFYLTFITGYTTRVHKHLDDLSITLNYNKKDFFVDPGKFNYSKSPIRRYMMRAPAHSTIFFREKDIKYKRTNENRFTREVRNTGYYHGQAFSLVSGLNESFSESRKLERVLISFNKYDLVFILDKAYGMQEELIQNFNLHEDVKIDSKSDGTVLTHDETSITLKQFEQNELNIIKGEDEEAIAKNTVGFGKSTDTYQLQYSTLTEKGRRFDFVTAINMGGHKMEAPIFYDAHMEVIIEGEHFRINY